MIDLNEKHIEIIKNIIKKHLPNTSVWVFGSRIKGTAKKYSDIDLVIVKNQKIDRKILYELAEEFEESDLPIRVEILDYCRISDNFKKIINKQYEIFI